MFRLIYLHVVGMLVILGVLGCRNGSSGPEGQGGGPDAGPQVPEEPADKTPGGAAAPTPDDRAAQARAAEAKADADVAAKLAEIGLAFHKHLEAQGELPPVGWRLDDGPELLSWRVWLLPYLGHEKLFRQFDLEQPWNAQKNYRLLDKMPAIYASADVEETGHTRFLAFHGEGAMLDPGRGTSINRCADGTLNTLLVVHAPAGQAVPWTKPADLPFDRDDPQAAFRALGGKKTLAVSVAGTVHVLPEDLEPETLGQAIDRADGGGLDLKEVAPPYDFSEKTAPEDTPNDSPEDAAQQPVAERFSTTDAQGNSPAPRMSIGDVERYWIEGGTEASARWTIEGIEPKRSPYGLQVEIDLAVLRRPYQPLPKRTIVALRVHSPITPRTHVERVVAVPARAGATACFHIPRMLGDYYGQPVRELTEELVVPELRRSDGTPLDDPRPLEPPIDEPELYRHFVHDGCLDVSLHCLDKDCWLGVRAEDIRVAPVKPTYADDVPTEPPPESIDLDDVPGPKWDGSAYDRAIEACRRAWREYEAAIVDQEVAGTRLHGILVSDEVRIATELMVTLLACPGEIEMQAKVTEKADDWIHAAALYSMLGADGEALRCAEKAAALDARHKSAAAWLAAQPGESVPLDLRDAYRRLSEAIEADPENVHLRSARAELGAQMDMASATEDEEKVRQLEKKLGPRKRALPWRWVYPFDEAIRGLGREVPRRDD